MEMVDWNATIAGLTAVTAANKAYHSAGGGPTSINRQFNIVDSNITAGMEMETNTWQPTDATYTTAQGIGLYNSRFAVNDGVGFRGGIWSSATFAGIYSLTMEPTGTSGIWYGFRCVYRP